MAIERAIIDFYQDEHKHWVAYLECGHTQRVRHHPPWEDAHSDWSSPAP